MKILVDSSVLLDVLTQDPEWAGWSEEKLAVHAERDLLAINPIIYAEVSAHFSTIEELNEALSPEDFQRLPLPYEAGFLAARCFLLYRRRGGQKHAPLPDFYIGAHAATEGLMLLTRDVSRYRTYFPSIQLIAPHGSSDPGVRT
jgi:predicted nucleic acid-binding protein